MGRPRPTTSAPATRSQRSSLRVLTFSAQRRSWCTALIPMARCAWSKNFGGPVDQPSTFHFIFWKTEFEISGRDEAKAKGKSKKEKLLPRLIFLLPFYFCL